ncbi:unnamed protein product [Boreogadus saida]
MNQQLDRTYMVFARPGGEFCQAKQLLLIVDEDEESFKSPDGMENEIHQPFTYLLRSLPDSAVLGNNPYEDEPNLSPDYPGM